MNINIKNVLIFVAGLGIGAFVTNMILKEKFEEALQEEQETILRQLSTERRPRGVKTQELTLDDVKYGKESNDPTVLRHPYLKERYNKIVKQYAPTDDETEDCEITYGNDRKIHKPYIITLEQFSEEMDNHDKLTITYFAEDNTLADENEEIIVDVVGTIGDSAIDNFGYGNEDPEVVYVRNERMCIDYEIYRDPRKYSEVVLGMRENGHGY